jgi:hypothetical protein
MLIEIHLKNHHPTYTISSLASMEGRKKETKREIKEER